MKRFIKSYHVFLPQIWSKLFTYVVYPVAILLIAYWLVSWKIPMPICVMVVCSLILTVEVLWDSTVFGGIASKNTNKLEYLKTSVRGMRILRNSIVADAVRRAISVTVILAVLYAMNTSALALWKMVACGFVGLWCIELALLLTRSFSMMVVMLLAVSIGGGICMAVCGIVLLGVGSVWNLCFAILPYILFVVTGRIVIMRKARGSYYDERD